jgi:hypothetical protein
VEEFAHVWLASAGTMWSGMKFKFHDEAGTLRVSPEGIAFKSKKKSLTITKVAEVSLVRPTPPWLVFGLVNALIIVNSVRDNLGRLWTFWVFLAFLNLCGLPAMLARWIRIAYVDEGGQPQEVFVTDGSWLGYGRLFGGSQRIRDAIYQCFG